MQLWATDEHRIGLLALIRRVWAPKGKRPIAPVQQRYEWLYVCGFVRPTTGETEWWLLSAVNAVAFGLVLAAFARDLGAGAAKQPARAPWSRLARICVRISRVLQLVS